MLSVKGLELYFDEKSGIEDNRLLQKKDSSMKKGLLLSMLLLLSFVFCFYPAHPQKSKFSSSLEKPFVIVIPSYNNSAYCKKNLTSVLDQNYANFRVIYIDDCSSDDTFAKVEALVAGSPHASRCILQRNTSNQGALANLYRAVHSCRDEEIVLIVDGDDYLAHENVLQILNKTYADPDVWMTYGNYLDYPSFKQEPHICKEVSPKVIAKGAFRSVEWSTSHLRTFYASLFKKIRLSDLLYEGKFFPMGADLACTYPLLEMAGSHSRFIKDVLYLYNRSNPLNDHKKDVALQRNCADCIKKLPRYAPLGELPSTTLASDAADIVIFSYDRPLQLHALLESIEKYISRIQSITVIYRSSAPEFQSAYETVNNTFPHARFIAQSERPQEDFKPLLLQAVYETKSPYVLFAVDDMIVKDFIDLGASIHALEAAQAYGFYFSHSTSLKQSFMRRCSEALPPLVPLGNMYAWQFKHGEIDWKYPNSLDMVLYRKEEIRKDLLKMSFHNPNTFEDLWDKRAQLKKIGLFYEDSKVVGIPLNLVNPSDNRALHTHSAAELLEKYKRGLKLDIAPLYQIKNSSKHIPYEPTFIRR